MMDMNTVWMLATMDERPAPVELWTPEPVKPKRRWLWTVARRTTRRAGDKTRQWARAGLRLVNLGE